MPVSLRRPEPTARQPLQQLQLTSRRSSTLDPAGAVNHDFEPAFGHDAGVQLFERTGGRVARIGKRLLPRRHPLRVDAPEHFLRQIHLPAHFHQPRQIPASPEPERNAADGSEVGGDVVPRGAVPAGGPPGEHPVLVGHHHRQPVDLQLADEADRAGPDHPFDPLAPGLQLLEGERVVQRQHRGPVRHGGEQLGRGPTHPLRRAVRRDQLGELALQLLELPDHPVVVVVGHLGIVQDVVAVRVVVDPFPELLGPLARVGERPLLALAPLLWFGPRAHRRRRLHAVADAGRPGAGGRGGGVRRPARGLRPGRSPRP